MSSVDDETILEVLRSSDEPRLTTTEVADELPITRGTTRTRLQTLVDEGLVTREREGRNVVWWLPERTDEAEAEADSATATESDDDPAGEDDGHGEQASETEGVDEAEEEDADDEADEAEEEETDEEPAAEEEADEEPVGEPEQAEPSVHAEENGEVETDEDDELEVTTPDRETKSPTEQLPEAPQDDRTVQAVLALFVLAVLYALVRRLRG